jgi:hypothetical protein
MTWVIIALLLTFLLPLAFYFVSIALLYYQTAMLDKEMARYLKYCRRTGQHAEDRFMPTLSKE